MGIWTLQSNLNRGEIDPRAIGRVDLDAYYNGVRSATNCLPIPQGGMKKRPGMEYLGTAIGNGRIEKFAFNTTQQYLLVFTDQKMQVYKDGVLQTNLNGSGNNYITTPWTLAQLADVDFIQSADTAIIVHEDVAPRSLTRTGHTTWTLSTISFDFVPQFDFNDGSSPTPTSAVQDLTFTNMAEGDRYKLALEGVLTDELVFAGDDATNNDNIQKALQALPNTPDSGITCATKTSGSAYTVTFAGSAAKPWKLITGTAIFTASTAFNVAAASTATGVSRAEDVWSATRGWPRTATFHEGRLWFGGSASRPATIWGSRVGDFYNFENLKARDDEAIDVTLDTDQVNAIQAIYSNRALQIFTTGQEFFVPSSSSSPITPSNIAVRPQTNFGSRRVRPATIDGVTLFTQRTGKSVNQFVYVEAYQANQTQSITTLAPHLITTPIQLAVSRGQTDDDANYVYILNNDGTLTVFNTLIVEDVQGFTPWTTDGDIKSIAVVDDTLYFLVAREVNSSTVYYIERENDDLSTDSGVRTNVGGSDTLTGLSHLNTETVDIKADDAYMGTDTVASGQVVIERTATVIEAGLPFRPTIQTMPLNVPLPQGPNAFKKKKIMRVALRVYEANGLIVNNQRIADKTIGLDQFDSPAPQTGIVRIYLTGWSLDASVTITQDTPMPMTILSIGVEVAQ